jgi:multicomponent K+:H+ antiporter subunit E
MTLLHRVLPAPLLSLGLFLLWIALSRSQSLGQVVLGALLGLALPLLTRRVRPRQVRVRRPLVAARYLLVVAGDVLASNCEVAWGVVTWRWRTPRCAFVRIPLDLRDPIGLAALAMVTTIVPGTVWSELALDRSALLLHGWNVEDEQAFVARFKQRYEQPLREIFE